MKHLISAWVLFACDLLCRYFISIAACASLETNWRFNHYQCLIWLCLHASALINPFEITSCSSSFTLKLTRWTRPFALPLNARAVMGLLECIRNRMTYSYHCFEYLLSTSVNRKEKKSQIEWLCMEWIEWVRKSCRTVDCTWTMSEPKNVTPENSI